MEKSKDGRMEDNVKLNSKREQADSVINEERCKQVEESVQQIIENARSAPASVFGAWLLSTISGLLMWASFPPLDWGAFGWLALVPLVMLIRLTKPTRWMYTAIYGGGLLFTLASFQWMRLGDPLMYIAWIALAVYCAFYFPVFVGLSRIAIHRLGLPLVFVVPVVWVGLEYSRAHLMTGFAWYFLGHTQYRWIELIQVSDLVGAYGVSFLVAGIAACLGLLIPATVFSRLHLFPIMEKERVSTDSASEEKRCDRILVGAQFDRRAFFSIVVFGVLFVVSLGYGQFRLSIAQFTAGPRIALIQGNFIASIRVPTDDAKRIIGTHDAMTDQTVLEKPDIIVWPEGMFRLPLMKVPLSYSDRELQSLSPHISPADWRDPLARNILNQISERTNAALITGLIRYEVNVETDTIAHYNSAIFVNPDKGIQSHYDKIHLVPFGEYLPFSKIFPSIKKMPAFAAMGGGLDAGESGTVFQYKEWRLVPVICFEDTVPHVVRKLARNAIDKDGKRADVLVTLTNDGWFHGSSEHDQHLITSVFRAVELRTPLVRAANMGISSFIDGDGVIREPDVFIDGEVGPRNPARKQTMRDPKTGKFYRKFTGALVATVPLDSRGSFYLVWGDWFAASCCILMILVGLSGFVIPSRFSSRRKRASS